MGCGASNSKKNKDDNNEFYREAFGISHTKKKGLSMDNYDSTRAIQNYGDALNFKEEIITHADESSPVKPWLENVIPPDVPLIEDLTLPRYNLSIRHVFGFRTEDSRKNLFFLQNDQILYTCSSLAIIQNIDDKSQIYFGGFPIKENKECHNDTITSIDFMQRNVSMVATGQAGLWPKILVWSPVDPDVIYAKFTQPKSSVQVSALSFDRNGHYLASFGKDDLDSFYIFDLRLKELYYTGSTYEDGKPNNYLLDLCFNPYKDELILVGVDKIILVVISLCAHKNLYKAKEGIPEKKFTCVTFISNNAFLIGSEAGKIYKYVDEKKERSHKFSDGSIQVIAKKRINNKILFSDSLSNVFFFNYESFSISDSFKTDSPVKSLDINVSDLKILMGLKNGDIKIKYYSKESRHEELFLKTHSEGSINDFAYVPESKVLTVGDDNKIILWNLKSKKCDSWGNVIDRPSLFLRLGKEREKGECISYNLSKENIAIGTSLGNVSIRKGVKQLDIKDREDIHLDSKPIIALDFTPYGDLLLVSSKSNNLYLLDTNKDYETVQNFKLDSYIKCFDWDVGGKFIQGITKDNKYIFLNVDKKEEYLVKPEEVKNTEWMTITCKFNYTVQGIFQGSTNPKYITAVSKANSKKLVCFGNDDYLINLCNYPCITENPKIKKYRGHSGKIKKIYWCLEDSRLITIAKGDKTLIYWMVEEEILDEKIT